MKKKNLKYQSENPIIMLENFEQSAENYLGNSNFPLILSMTLNYTSNVINYLIDKLNDEQTENLIKEVKLEREKEKAV